ncbi:hypothetical protein [Xanthomarina sp. GH4-25]|uniref:hypothetical protein n=1 Tax=Xanthomarina sp. GH4-25 TaxID=3349335 RepID=UPI003877FCEA
MKYPIIYLFVFFTSFVFAQKNNTAIIYYNSGESKQFSKAQLAINSEGFITGIETKTTTNQNQVINLVGVSKVNYEGTIFTVKTAKSKPYLFETVISGSLSLYKSGEHYFLENEEYGFNEIERKKLNDLTLGAFNYGPISLYINKCLEAQELAYNKHVSIILSNLKSIIEVYNNCNLSEETQIASNVMKEANASSETIEVGVNIGYNFLNTSFENFSPGVTNNYGAPTIGAQIYFNTNMLNENIGFILSVDYSFPEEFESNANNVFIKSKLSYINSMIGFRYTINNVSKTLRPYLGFNGGIIFNSNSYVIIQEASVGSTAISFETTNKLVYNVGLGTYIHFGKQKIDFNLSYQPENKFVLLSNNTFYVNESFYKLSGFQLKATYVF